jgi:predicted DNA binding CopG/RHH family protein
VGKARIRVMRFSAAVMLIGLLIAGCGSSDEGDAGSSSRALDAQGGGDSGGGGDGEQSLDERMAAVPYQDEAGVMKGAAMGGSAVPSISDSIIKTAQIELEVDKGQLDEVVRDTELLASRFGGFVFSTSIEESEAKSGSVVIRVPSEDFEATKKAIAAEGTVIAESTSGKDVSQEFIDLEARIRNLEAQESVILGLMRKATTIPQSIRVQNELSGLQLEIERLTGRLRFLEDRTAYATIAIDFTEAGAPAPQKAGTLQKAWEKAIDVALAIASASIISLGFVIPIGIAALIALLIFRQLKPRFSDT